MLVKQSIKMLQKLSLLVCSTSVIKCSAMHYVIQLGCRFQMRRACAILYRLFIAVSSWQFVKLVLKSSYWSAAQSHTTIKKG